MLTPIILPLTNFRKKDVDAYLLTQIDHVKRTCAGHVPTIQIAKHFTKYTNHPLNKWHIASSEAQIKMLKNYDVWGSMGVDSQVTLSILHAPTVVSNRDGDTVIRGFYGTSLGTKL